MDNTALTATDILKAKFLAIAPDVTPDDKKELIAKENFAMTTINYYLQGQVLNVNTGITILSFFKEKVEARRKLIDQL